MTPETNPAPEQPGQATPDSNAAKGIQPGGVPPDMETMLSQATPDLAQAVRSHLERQNSSYTKNMQALRQDTDVARRFKELKQDPKFSRFVRAYEEQDWDGYHREGLGPSAAPLPSTRTTPVAQPEDNLPATAPDESGGESPEARFLGLQEQLAQTNKTLEQQQKELSALTSRAAAKEFADKPQSQGWEDFSPLMLKELQENPGISLDKALILAKHRAAETGTPTTSAGEGAQAPAQPGPPPPISSSVTHASMPARKYSTNIRKGLGEALKDAMKVTGISLP